MDRIPKKDFWQNHIEKWDKSGLSQIDYCTNHRIPLSTFGYWKRKLKKADDVKPVFYPLTIPADQSNNRVNKETELTLDLKNGRFTINVKKGFSPTTLSQMVTTLEQL